MQNAQFTMQNKFPSPKVSPPPLPPHQNRLSPQGGGGEVERKWVREGGGLGGRTQTFPTFWELSIMMETGDNQCSAKVQNIECYEQEKSFVLVDCENPSVAVVLPTKRLRPVWVYWLLGTGGHCVTQSQTHVSGNCNFMSDWLTD